MARIGKAAVYSVEVRRETSRDADSVLLQRIHSFDRYGKISVLLLWFSAYTIIGTFLCVPVIDLLPRGQFRWRGVNTANELPVCPNAVNGKPRQLRITINKPVVCI